MSPLSKEYTTEESGFRPPAVTHFKGDLTDITDESRHNDRSGKDSNWFVFDFTDIRVIESSEPYTFPTFRIETIELNMPNTQWDVMKKSLRERGIEGSIDQVLGKTCEMHWTTAVLSQPDGNGGYANKLGNCWQFVNIEGIENTGDKLFSWCADNADGKTASEFKTSYLAEPSIKTLTGYGAVTISVMQDQLLPTFVESGTLTVDDGGVYHKVG